MHKSEIENTEHDNVLLHVATNLRRLRIDSGLSQDALAKAAGLSRRMVVNLEGGDTNISLSKLSSLSRALNVELSTLVANPSVNSVLINELMWRGKSDASLAVLLGNAPARSQVQIWSWTLDLDETYIAEPDPLGWREMIYVFEGRLRINKDDGDLVLISGGFTMFESSQNYSYQNAGDKVVRFTRLVIS